MKHPINCKIVKLICAMLISILPVSAQQKSGGFNPKKFEADLEQYITTNACLTPQEAEVFPSL